MRLLFKYYLSTFYFQCMARPSEANGYWGGGGGAGNSGNLRGSGGMHPQIILKSRTPEIRFPASWEVIFYRKAHYKLEIWERVDRD